MAALIVAANGKALEATLSDYSAMPGGPWTWFQLAVDVVSR